MSVESVDRRRRVQDRLQNLSHVKLLGVGVRHVCIHREMSLASIAVLIEVSSRRCGVDVCAWLIF